MESENRIVCFIDILGFKEIIKQFEESQDISIIKHIQDAFNEALLSMIGFYNKDYSKTNNIENVDVETLKSEFYFKTFSDNIIFTLKFSKTDKSFWGRLSLILSFAHSFQQTMHRAGIYIRGGISYGSFYNDENIIFSQALVESYEIENTQAIYPRIVLHKSIKAQLVHLGKLLYNRFNFDDLLYIDGKNELFITPFLGADSLIKSFKELVNDLEETYLDNPELDRLSKFSEEQKEILLNMDKHLHDSNMVIVNDAIAKSNVTSYNENIREKYNWLVEFYNWKYNSVKSKYLFENFSNALS